MDPSGNVCWEGCHGARAGMSRVFLLESQMDGGGGNRLVLHLIPVRTWVSCPYMRGSQPAYPQPLPASGLGPAVVQLAGAVDYPGPREEARTPRKERRAKDHRAPNHISKMVPPTVHSSPPNWARTPYLLPVFLPVLVLPTCGLGRSTAREYRSFWCRLSPRQREGVVYLALNASSAV